MSSEGKNDVEGEDSQCDTVFSKAEVKGTLNFIRNAQAVDAEFFFAMKNLFLTIQRRRVDAPFNYFPMGHYYSSITMKR